MWQSTVPTTGTNIIDISTIFPGNWEAIENILGEEHYTFSNELSGRHVAGKTAVLCSDATTGITGTVPPGNGALGFDTTFGSLLVYLNSSWAWITTFPQTYVRAYIGSGDQSIPPSGSPVAFNTEISDPIGEYNTTTYTFTPASDGFFLITAVVSIMAIGGITVNIAIVHNDSNDNQKNYTNNASGLVDNNRKSIVNQMVTEAIAGDKIYINITHNRTIDIIAEAGSDRSLLTIRRIS